MLIMPIKKNKLVGEMKIKGIEIILLASGAIAGAFLRYKIASSPIILDTFSLNILIINVIGSFVLGVFSILSVSWNLDPKYSLLIATGFCGSLTTMSAFALESVQLLDNQQVAKFILNILANVGLSIAALIIARSVTIILMKIWENGG